jgi:hypothetical protein
MESSELLGTLVLVNPEIENDPAGRKGDIGVVAYVDNPNDEIYLRFPDEFEAVYPGDAIFALKNKETIFAEQAADVKPVDLNDYKDLFKITLLQDMGRSIDIWNALEIARDNPGIWPNSLVSVGQGHDRQQAQSLGR